MTCSVDEIIATMARALVNAEYERNPNHKTQISYAREDAKAALSALSAAGFVVVPVTPTREMASAGMCARFGGFPELSIYAAMIEAAQVRP